LGAFALFSAEKDTFTEEDEHNIAALANSLAISIENRKTKEEILQLNTQLEQRVAERTAQLQTSNEELEAFAYSVSHDLRVPLRSIDGYACILHEDYGDKLDEEGKRLLDNILTNTAKMGKLITDLLALSKVNRSELKLTLIDMSNLVKSVYRETITPEEQERFTFNVDPLSDVFGDLILLRQVWSNLISNAIKYTLPKKECTIQVKSYIEGDMTIYTIQDNGVGFNPEHVHKLFGVFQRLHNADQFDGSGIGLAIVKRIIERHGGRAWAEGAIDLGAKFSFSLPTRQK
jgi:light-regulated signal transduction histidine kinase (bacteriophytochrome)